jgi:hypothetical protein
MHIEELGPKDRPLAAIEINYFYIGFRSLLRHLRRLPRLEVRETSSWIPTDDYYALIDYKGYKIEISSPFVDFWVERDSECPESIFLEIVEHVRSFKPIFLNRWAGDLSRWYRSKRLRSLSH